MRKMLLAWITGILIVVLLFGCAPAPSTPVPANDPSAVDSKCVWPESDNGSHWRYGSCVDVTTTAYNLIVVVEDEIKNHTEVGANGSAFIINGMGSASYRMWQDGKGLLPVRILSITPSYAIVPAGTNIILKTSDLKAMALPTGATTTFICNLDTEVLSPVENNQILTEDRITYEFDDCRMVSPIYLTQTP